MLVNFVVILTGDTDDQSAGYRLFSNSVQNTYGDIGGVFIKWKLEMLFAWSVYYFWANERMEMGILYFRQEIKCNILNS